MIFNSLIFVAFFAIVLGLHSLPLPWNAKKINLLIASYIFYAAWNPPFVILLWVSTVVDWFAARALVTAKDQWHRRLWMLISVIANVGMLGYFKYGQFLVDSFSSIALAVGLHYSPPKYDIVLPIGISFYTFATMSYTLDVYLRRAAPARNFLDYALFVTFFPHLVAGPIMRPTELVPQFATPRKASGDQLRFGLALMTLGLFQKVVLADGFLGPVVEAVYDADKTPGMLDSWMATIAFSGQIFCDFAGYSTTAIGVALCLGFAMPDNFRFPYASIGFSDFWRRWHISLSSWLRDYVYIPLGGNRHGELRTYVSLMSTMLIGGLWHGASWTFVFWGGLHGVYLAIERLLRKLFRDYRPGPAAIAGLGLITFLLVDIAWVFFRAKTFAKASIVITGMAGLNAHPVPLLAAIYLATTGVIVGGILCAHWLMRNRTLEAVVARTHPVVVTGILAVMGFSVVAEHGAGDAFIYFQF
ncbi:D-alanyl-lipoteichoic acid acyltransferase DltB, MBOAT superfamily [Sphingomonas sp. YR710]|uniref:MBOAT family O-acyltransferase n=1 Tax=Sphingomonas sp. YR710 TaxID=1882773 RepID=UPI000890A46A|nr:MBOAT family O-acyltransferase [Sphingomonas sp. YR710]SDC00995.1 D-alanyl-lipoteichoic acid acyltransferase DltB, MBOAT superfamily [Sphingomonas sp. YR710]